MRPMICNWLRAAPPRSAGLEHRPLCARGAAVLARRFHSQGRRRLRQRSSPPARRLGKSPSWTASSSSARHVCGRATDRARLRAAMEGRRLRPGASRSLRRPSARSPMARAPPAGSCSPPRCPTSSTARSTPAAPWPWAAARWAQSDVVRAEQARNPDLPSWQALIAGQGRGRRAGAHGASFCFGTLDNYYCAYPVVRSQRRGGAQAGLELGRVALPAEFRGQRATATNSSARTFRGMTDTFLPERRRAQEILHALVACRPLVPAQRQNGRRAA